MKIAFTIKKTCVIPTFAGWLSIMGGIVVVGCVGVCAINPFLSLNKPTTANVMVVEGWLPDYAIKQALDEFNRKHYALLITTGVPLEKGFFLSGYKTYAELTAVTLKKLGMDSTKLAAVPSLDVKADRTFASAREVKKWIDRSAMSITAVNVISLGPHSRRTRLLYTKAFGDGGKKVGVGIESYPDPTYDARQWWKTSKGFRTVSDEFIAYMYARFIFTIKRKLP